MKLIPAIDLIDGKCVRLKQGDFNQKTIFSDKPEEVAKKWEEEGASLIHLVDLEGSRQGFPIEIETIKKIKKSVSIPIEIGGGVRKLEDIEKLFDAGVNYVILGTSVAANEDFAKEAFEKYGDSIIVGIDAKDGYVAVKGWEEVTKYKAIEFAQKMESLGAKKIIYTDISRDGMMQGVNDVAMKIMAESLNIPVIASGGVSTYEDIKKLKAIEKYGVEGAIIGKALYTGDIILSEALKW